MKLLGALLAINTVYFAWIGYLTYRARASKQEDCGKPFLRLHRKDSWDTWLEFTAEWCLPALNVSNKGYDDRQGRYVLLQVYWIFGKLFLHLPIKPWFKGQWGISCTDIDGDGWQQIHWNYGSSSAGKYTIWDMPWSFSHYRTRYLTTNGWETEMRGQRIPDRWDDSFRDRVVKEQYPYTYLLDNGIKQERIATISYEERQWRRKWLPFTGLFKLERKTISIDFNKEIGERSEEGTRPSWKGGTIGCSYQLRPGETGEQALRRMERTRKF